MKKLFLSIFLSALISISYANYLDDWSNEDLCRWMDADPIPENVSKEIDMRQLSCYVSCYTGELTAKIPDCKENINIFKNFSEFDNTIKTSGNQFLKNPVFNGIDMSGFTPPSMDSMDSRIYYINGHQQISGSVYIDALKRYLESIGRGNAFSESPPEVQMSSPIKFNFKITL